MAAVVVFEPDTNGWSRGELPPVELDPLWCLVFDGFDADQERRREALLALANGNLGCGGATLSAHPTERRWLLVNGLYDGEGAESRLLAGPVGWHLPYQLDPGAMLRRVLDLRRGVVYEEASTDAGIVRTLRFASMAEPSLLVMRAVTPDERLAPLLTPSTGSAVLARAADGADVAWMSAGATDGIGGVVAAAVETRAALDGAVMRDRVIAYDVDRRQVPGPDTAVRRVREAAAAGFDRLLADHYQWWARRWEDADITIEGAAQLQLSVRFALFHLMGSVPETGQAAVGARGLTGEGYRGHVFWDADTFTLPFLAATCPPAARAMLEYRLARLPAALEIARRRNRAGARFPWESARSGQDVTPTFARDRIGRVVPIRTGQIQEHIVADVPWAAASYVDWTGDEQFAAGPQARLLVESARYWRSRVRRGADGAAHIYGVIGPDEYHEPVDDNAFTNVMARWNLRRATDVVEADSVITDGPQAGEVAAWRAAADALVDGYDPNTGLYEQCAGFFGLETLLIEEVAPRRPIAADQLLGADRVHGAQILKQADVLMLHHLVPDEVAPGSLEPNLRFYEPRTAHGSSLSPAIHASLFARARDFPRALDSLELAARIDLDDLTGTSAAGMHIATMGGLWQALVFGFAGLQPRSGRLGIDPRLPPSWGALEVNVRFRGSRVRVRIERNHLTVHADPPATVTVGSHPHIAGHDALRLARRGARWERQP